VHSHGYRADIVDAMHLRRTVPIVTTVHGYTGGGIRNRVYEGLQRRAFRQFDGVVAVSAQLGRELGKAVRSECLHVLPNAFHPPPLATRAAARAALGIPVDSFVAGWVGRMSKEKGADVLLDALGDA
jgi:glycosyltransferase involved in cell wall biosynthesis